MTLWCYIVTYLFLSSSVVSVCPDGDQDIQSNDCSHCHSSDWILQYLSKERCIFDEVHSVGKNHKASGKVREMVTLAVGKDAGCQRSNLSLQEKR